jgi:hypothetical protein
MDSKIVLPAVLALILGLLIGSIIYSTNCKAKVVNAEKFSEYDIQGVVPMPRATSVADASKPFPDAASAGIGDYDPSNPLGNEVYNSVSPEVPSEPSSAPTCYPRDRLTAEDLLPKDAANSKWAQLNPVGQGDVQDQNFLTAGYHVGVNTQGQSLRNANYQLRSEPANPQQPVSPWNIATIEPDINRKPLEIGGDF